MQLLVSHPAESTMFFHLRRRGIAKKAPKADNPWALELVSLLISITALVAIVVTVSKNNRKPLPKLPLGITLNTAISIFATTMKTTILFCAAGVISQSKWIWFYRRP